MIIDTHTHLDDKSYLNDLDKVIQEAIKSGVVGFLLPGADTKDLDRAREIAYSYKNTYYAAGVHPYCVSDYDEKILIKHLKDKRCIAVGECGLDYFRLPKDNKARMEQKLLQQRVFKDQIRLSKEFKKPLIVHIRDANEDSKRSYWKWSR